MTDCKQQCENYKALETEATESICWTCSRVRGTAECNIACAADKTGITRYVSGLVVECLGYKEPEPELVLVKCRNCTYASFDYPSKVSPSIVHKRWCHEQRCGTSSEANIEKGCEYGKPRLNELEEAVMATVGKRLKYSGSAIPLVRDAARVLELRMAYPNTAQMLRTIADAYEKNQHINKKEKNNES